MKNERSFLSGAITCKSTSQKHYTLAGYGVLFDRYDLQHERFTKSTEFGLARQPEGMPVLYEHGRDQHVGLQSVGLVKSAMPDETGLWFELQIARASKYAEHIKELADRGLLGLSTGAIGHMIQREGSDIKAWPIGEISITVQPAEPSTIGVKTKSAPEAPEGHETGGSPMAVHNTEASQNTGQKHEASERQQPEATPASASDHASSSERASSDQGHATAMKRIEERMATIESLITKPASASSQKAALIPGDTSTRQSDHEVAYMKSFSEYMKTGDRSAIKREERAYKAAMEIGTPSEGGFLVPETWSTEAIRALNDIAILRNNGARVQSANTTKAFHVPAIVDSAAAVLTDEEGAYTQGEPTVSEVEFVPYKYTKLALASEELVEDSPLDIMSQVLIPDWAQAFASAENTATATGNGSSAPQGIIAGASNVTDTATSGAFVPEDIITLYHALDHNYRQRAVWLLDDQTARVIRTFREAVYDGTSTTSGGQFLWQPGLREGEPDRLLGRPVITFNAMDGLTGASSQTAGTKFLAFADLSYFWIVDFGMMYMQRLDELYAANGRVGFRAFRRFDSNIMLQEAIQVMAIKA